MFEQFRTTDKNICCIQGVSYSSVSSVWAIWKTDDNCWICIQYVSCFLVIDENDWTWSSWWVLSSVWADQNSWTWFSKWVTLVFEELNTTDKNGWTQSRKWVAPVLKQIRFTDENEQYVSYSPVFKQIRSTKENGGICVQNVSTFTLSRSESLKE